MAELKEQTYQETFHVGQHAELTLRNVRGGVEITGWERPEVSVVAVKKLGTEWGARESFENTTVEMQQSGQHVRVRTRHLGGGGLFGWIGIGRTLPQVFYTVHVPVTSDVSVRTVNGPLRVSDIIGTIYLRTVDGLVEIKRLSGQVIISGVDATITGSDLGGTLAVKTISGDVAVAQSRLSSFWCNSVNGGARLETTIDSSGAYEVKSINGAFRLMVPADSRMTAQLRSVSGSASCALPHRVTEDTRGNWEALVNGGGARVFLKSVNGDLTIEQAAEPIVAAAPTGAPSAAATPAPDRDWPEMSILKAVERGEMTVEEAIAKLAELDKS